MLEKMAAAALNDEPGHVDYLRHELRRALRCLPSGMASTFGAIPTPRPGSEKARTETRTKRTSRSLTARGSATRKFQKSAPLYDGAVGQIAAIWKLPPAHIAVLLAKYSSARRDRVLHANRLASAVAERYRADKVKTRVRIMVLAVIDGGDAEDVQTLLGMTPKRWREANCRRTFYQVRRSIRALDSAALQEWGRRAGIN